MDLILKKENFVNNKLYVSYGIRQQAMFTIVDETFKGTNNLGRVNVVTCMTRKLDTAGNTVNSSMSSMVIGLGDGHVGAVSSVPELRGKQLTQDNMEQCTVTLYED